MKEAGIGLDNFRFPLAPTGAKRPKVHVVPGGHIPPGLRWSGYPLHRLSCQVSMIATLWTWYTWGNTLGICARGDSASWGKEI